MNLEEARAFINSVPFVVAKSYEKTFPHWYTTRDRVQDDERFEAFLALIRERGKLKSFHSKQYLYLEIDSFEYWEMGRPIKSVVVLNRALIDDSKPYRFPSPNPQDEQLLKSKLKEREEYLEALLSKPDKTERDKIQLEFLLNNTRRIQGGGKNIIDHSKLPLRYE